MSSANNKPIFLFKKLTYLVLVMWLFGRYSSWLYCVLGFSVLCCLCHSYQTITFASVLFNVLRFPHQSNYVAAKHFGFA